MGRGVPGRGVPVKKSIWAEESRAEMVLGRGVPEPVISVFRCFGVFRYFYEPHSFDSPRQCQLEFILTKAKSDNNKSIDQEDLKIITHTGNVPNENESTMCGGDHTNLPATACLFIIRKIVTYPIINFTKCHFLFMRTVYGKCNQIGIRIWWFSITSR